MAKDLVAAYPAARIVWEKADDALGVPLSTVAFDGPVDELTLTQNAQPALLAHGAAVWAVVRGAARPLVQRGRRPFTRRVHRVPRRGALPRSPTR